MASAAGAVAVTVGGCSVGAAGVVIAAAGVLSAAAAAAAGGVAVDTSSAGVAIPAGAELGATASALPSSTRDGLFRPMPIEKIFLMPATRPLSSFFWVPKSGGALFARPAQNGSFPSALLDLLPSVLPSDRLDNDLRNFLDLQALSATSPGEVGGNTSRQCWAWCRYGPVYEGSLPSRQSTRSAWLGRSHLRPQLHYFRGKPQTSNCRGYPDAVAVAFQVVANTSCMEESAWPSCMRVGSCRAETSAGGWAMTKSLCHCCRIERNHSLLGCSRIDCAPVVRSVNGAPSLGGRAAWGGHGANREGRHIADVE